MRENRTSGSEGGEAQTNELSLPLFVWNPLCTVRKVHAATSGVFSPTALLRSSKDSRHSFVARLAGDENPSRINPADFPDSTLGPK